MTNEKKILWYLFHPNMAESRGNRILSGAAHQLPNVTVIDAYAEFTSGNINVEAQQDMLREHDLIVFQHPFYWYSSPGLFKDWMDRVLTYGFAYPPKEGRALHGKHWLQVITTGGPEWSYRSGGYNNFSMSELLRPFQATATLCGMRWHTPFVVHSVLPADYGEIKAAGDDQLVGQADALKEMVAALDLNERHSLESLAPPHFLSAVNA